MNQYICLLIVLLLVLFVYNLINYGSLIEPLENKDGTTSKNSCQADNILIYKNAGTIQSLQDKMKQLMDQVNTLILTSDKQTTSIQHLQTLDTKYDKLATQADDLANENKQRLLAMAKESKAKYNSAAKQSNNLPSP